MIHPFYQGIFFTLGVILFIIMLYRWITAWGEKDLTAYRDKKREEDKAKKEKSMKKC